MFRNLRTSTKLLLLSGMFIVSLLVAAYGWLAEKQIAIDFARKELIGTRYLGALGKVYAGVLTDDAKPAEVLRMLAAAEVDAAGSLNSAELERDLAAAIRKHFEDAPDGIDQSRLVDTLSKARDLAARNRRQLWARSRSRSGQLLRAENSGEGTAFTASAVGRTSDLAEHKTRVGSRWRQ